MKCLICGGEYRLTMIKGKTYCFKCEIDVSMEQYGIVRQIKERTA
jgi:hypothetical protein